MAERNVRQARTVVKKCRVQKPNSEATLSSKLSAGKNFQPTPHRMPNELGNFSRKAKHSETERLRVLRFWFALLPLLSIFTFILHT